MGTFRQDIGSEQITFQKVIDCYKSEPIGISEVFKPGIGWFKPMGLTPMGTMVTIENVYQLAMSGVEHFNFEVINEYETIVYPDFSLNELVK